MKKQSMYRIAAILLFAAIAMAIPQFAQAAGTVAGVSISNQATVDYTVGTVPQTQVPGNTVTFVVDRVIYLTVTKQSDVTSAPSSTFQAVEFLVTNNSNTAMRFALTPVSKASNTVFLTGSGPSVYLDNNKNGKYDSGETLYADASTFGDVASGASLTVMIVGDIPGTATNGLTAVYDLVATAVDAGTTNVSTQTAGTKAANLNVVMTIFGDTAGSNTTLPDNARDGMHSASGTFTVTAAGMSVNKTVTVYWDPVNLLVNPKAIPGAIIIYTITVTNAAGGANATNVAITDDMSAMIGAGNFAFKNTYVDGTNTCVGSQGIVVNGTCNTNASGDDNADFTSNKVTVSGLTVNAGTTTTIKYQVVIQ